MVGRQLQRSSGGFRVRVPGRRRSRVSASESRPHDRVVRRGSEFADDASGDSGGTFDISRRRWAEGSRTAAVTRLIPRCRQSEVGRAGTVTNSTFGRGSTSAAARTTSSTRRTRARFSGTSSPSSAGSCSPQSGVAAARRHRKRKHGATHRHRRYGLVMDAERFSGQEDRHGVVTAAAGAETGYQTFQQPGDVIVFEPYGTSSERRSSTGDAVGRCR